MPCSSCVDKLAYKLMNHHKIDMIRAYELAEKGVERTENRPSETFSGTGNPTDYSKTCTAGTCTGSSSGCTKEGLPCVTNTNCVGGACIVSGDCGCPAPLAHSHQISVCSKVCTASGTCAKCVSLFCSPTCGVSSCLTGTCGYDCDVGYVWNPATLQCEIPIVPSVGSYNGNLIVVAVSMLSNWIRRRRKHKFIVMLK